MFKGKILRVILVNECSGISKPRRNPVYRRKEKAKIMASKSQGRCSNGRSELGVYTLSWEFLWEFSNVF